MAIREFFLETLSFDTNGAPFTIEASGRLQIRTGEKDYYPSRLKIDAKLSDALHAKIVRLIEEEVAAQLEAQPTATGEPAKYDDELADA